MRSVAADLLVLRKRTSTWTLLGIWVLLGITFAYLLPYLTYRGGGGALTPASLSLLLPESLIAAVLGGFPVFGGVIALMLGVLVIGSDYGWDTIKTVLSQRSGRVPLLLSKLTATWAVLVVFTLAMFMAGALAGYAIATTEGATIAWPAPLDLIVALATGWFLLAVWAAIGFGLAVLFRGTALAIGLGILYALLVESILTALADQVSWLAGLVEFSLRANAYSLVTAIGVPPDSLADNGPGGFFGPFVGTTQATMVLCAYAAFFIIVSAGAFTRRDIA